MLGKTLAEHPTDPDGLLENLLFGQVNKVLKATLEREIGKIFHVGIGEKDEKETIFVLKLDLLI